MHSFSVKSKFLLSFKYIFNDYKRSFTGMFEAAKDDPLQALFCTLAVS
jgi:hypothetical protein